MLVAHDTAAAVGDPAVADGVEMIDEVGEQLVVTVEFEPERSPNREIVDHRCLKIIVGSVHDDIPGHGGAIVANMSRSSLAYRTLVTV